MASGIELSKGQKSLIEDLSNAGGTKALSDVNARAAAKLDELEIVKIDAAANTVTLTDLGTSIALGDTAEGKEDKAKVAVVTGGLTFGEVADIDVGTSLFDQLSAEADPEKRKPIIRQLAQKSVGVARTLEHVQAELFYEISENQYYKDWLHTDPVTGEERPFTNFSEYCEQELRTAENQAYKLAQTYKKLVVEGGCTKEDIKLLPWSKAAELAPVFSKDKKDELLKAISEKPLRELREMRKAIKEGDKAGSAEAAEPRSKVTFSLVADEEKRLKEALEIAGKLCGNTESTAKQLDFIVNNFMLSATVDATDEIKVMGITMLDQAVETVSRTYGVKLEVKDIVNKEQWAAMEELDKKAKAKAAEKPEEAKAEAATA